MSVDIVITGNRGAAKRKLREIKVRAEYPDRAWQAVGRYLAREVDKQFLTRGGNFGTPWKPLATSTIIQKRRQGYMGQPLVRTGAMKRGFLYPAIVKDARGSTASFGSDSDIASYQHHGTKMNGRQHIPARKIMKVTPKMRHDVRDILSNYITKDKT